MRTFVLRRVLQAIPILVGISVVSFAVIQLPPGDFLTVYVEEAMLEAGRDKDCVDASNWDSAHERHAFRILRHYRQGLYQEILERLPYCEVTAPAVDWDERTRTVAALMAAEKG